MKHLSALFLAVVCASYAERASALGFDERTGKVDLTQAAVGYPLEAVRPEVPWTIMDPSFTPLDEQALAERFGGSAEEAIEGGGFFLFGGDALVGYLDLRGVTGLEGRRVEIRIWQQPRGTQAEISLDWYAQGIDELLQGEWRGPVSVGSIAFQPTGRATDDGWVEWTSGPVDWMFGDRIPASILQLYDAQITGAQVGLSEVESDLRVALDGLAIYDLGPAVVPAASCNLANEETSCGTEGVCVYGQCADAATVFGAKFQDPDLRDQYLERRSFLVQSFEGGRIPQSNTDAFANALEQVDDDQVSVREYWKTIRTAYTNLADGHASAPRQNGIQPSNGGLCLHLGEADLLPQAGVHPMVFYISSRSGVTMLEEGDVLKEIDGQAVANWAPRARHFSHYGGDPAGREYISTPEVFEAAIYSGATVLFERCTTSSTATTTPCAANEVEQIEIDLAVLTSSVWTGNAPDWLTRPTTCDFRFRSTVPNRRDTRYTYAGVKDEDGIRYLQINGVPSIYYGPEWSDAVTDALEDGPPRFVLDQRSGSGGSIDAVDHLVSYLVERSELFSMEMYPPMDRPLTSDIRESLRTCVRSATTGLEPCGGFLEWRLGSSSSVNQATAKTSSVAILQGMDVSGNDFVSKMLLYRSQGATRFFGAAPTYGAFGVVWSMPKLPGEASGGSLQVQDTLFLASRTDPNEDFTTGIGVPPDEIVYQKQSDAVQGVDSVIEAAKAWLRQ